MAKIGLCDEMNFVYAEACKMLRTKINLIIPDELKLSGNDDDEKSHRCKKIGITSSIPGEGKSSTCINLAYTYAVAGNKVCLIEADMRLPVVAERLLIKDAPGLSNVLVGQCRVDSALQKFTTGKGVSMYVLTAGDIPPRPSELLDTTNMEKVLDALSNAFDYILVDLPPVTVVADPLIVSKYLDGMLLVVRKDRANKTALEDAVSQLELVDATMLGVVFNGSDGPQAGSSY